MTCQIPDSDLLYYGGVSRAVAEIAKWYGGRLENGYAQACRGSNPFLSVTMMVKRPDCSSGVSSRVGKQESEEKQEDNV